ncbi:MAG: hypothetical protein OXC95_14565, partial [Dehalococcoidia bacterium]|nr:hypothetical protein [Dehalococcoidia bacterium]
HLIQPARDIITSIRRADPSGNKLPKHLRGWNVNAKDGYGKATTVDLKDLLGMLVHVYYLRIDGHALDISNDFGKRAIVEYASFLEAISRLILSPAEVALVACHLARVVHLEHLACLRDIRNTGKSFQFPSVDIPGTGDFSALLWEIRRWPLVLEATWERFFMPESTPLEAGADVVDNRPFSQGRALRPNGDYQWSLGWRRNSTIATIDVDPLTLIDFVLAQVEGQAVRDQPN